MWILVAWSSAQLDNRRTAAGGIKLVCEGAMTVSRLRHIPGIGVDKVGDAADAAADPRFLRLENLDTDLRPPEVALEATRAAIDRDDANSYLPFQGSSGAA